ncbi:hypothetical protein [Nonomuraea jabiensis]|uniref:hypothetical protein n=1 Tax=Nonomuraea jabiensis TaxID=882448 RepID=UPI003D74DB88
MPWNFSDSKVREQWYHLLNQRQTWCDEHGTEIDVLSMSTVEAHHARVWLDHHADVLMQIVVEKIITIGPETVGERYEDDPDLEWYASIAETPGLPASVLRSACDWIDYAPLADTLGNLSHGGHNPQPAQRIEIIDGVEVTFYVMMIERGRWTFDGSQVKEGYETVSDAAVEVRLQLAGALAGPLADRQGHEVPDEVHGRTWRESIEPLLDKGWAGRTPHEFVRNRENTRFVLDVMSRGLMDEDPRQ